MGNVHSDGLGVLVKGSETIIENVLTVVPGRLMVVDGMLGGRNIGSLISMHHAILPKDYSFSRILCFC